MKQIYYKEIEIHCIGSGNTDFLMILLRYNEAKN